MFDKLSDFSLLPGIRSITSKQDTCFAFICDSHDTASVLQKRLPGDSWIYTDLYHDWYVKPSSPIDNHTIDKLIFDGYNFDRYQKFNIYKITFDDANILPTIYEKLIRFGYNTDILQNNMQLRITCVNDSVQSKNMDDFTNQLILFKSHKNQSIDGYLNNILFLDTIENEKYRTINKQEFSNIDFVEQNKESLTRSILRQYFYKIFRVQSLFKANDLSNKLQQQIILVRDFLYFITQKYIDDQIYLARSTNHNIKIHFDYLKTCKTYTDFNAVCKQAKHWRATNIKTNKSEQKLKKQSDQGVYNILDLSNGYYVAQLFTPEALDYESKHMNHCVGDGGFDDKVRMNLSQIYSIRNKHGEPYVTIEVCDNIVTQCESKNHTISNEFLRKLTQHFILTMNFDFPAIFSNCLFQNTCLFKQDGKIYDIFNLPQNFIIKQTLDLSGIGLTNLPDMATISVMGNFICCSNKLTNLKGAPKEIHGECNLFNNPLISLEGLSPTIHGTINLKETQLTKKSIVPDYLIRYIDSGVVYGISTEICQQWQDRIHKNAYNVIQTNFHNR